MTGIPAHVLLARIESAVTTVNLHLEAGNGPAALVELKEVTEQLAQLRKALK